MLEPAVDLHENLKPQFGLKPVVGRHGLHEDELFSDAALVELIDRYPRQHLYAFNMGRDPLKIDENRLALHDGVSGTALLEAVRSGRLWLNLTRVDRADTRYRTLISTLYAELSAQLPMFQPDTSQGTLLISSPQALVYYHADGPASVLWHLRGRKRVWVYPALNAQYMKPELLEDIFAGVRHEYLPYQLSYDEGAEIYDLEPGQWIAWPQNAPHRVTNMDSVNVSLSTEHFTQRSRQRFQLYVANRFFRNQLGISKLSTREDGTVAALKILSQRIARKLGLDPVQLRQHTPQRRVMPGMPEGVSMLDALPTIDRQSE